MEDASSMLSVRQAATPQPQPGGDNVFLNLLANPFQSQVQQSSFFAALGYSLGVSAILTILFCFLRPRVSHIYAPRAKHADSKHAPPRLAKGLFSWITPVRSVHELELVEKIGVDATIFLRFVRMTRNIFIVFAIIACAILIPINLTGASKSGGRSESSENAQAQTIAVLARLTPQFLYSDPSLVWAYVIIAYIATGGICFLLWSSYRKILTWRREYFESPDYQNSMHARSLMLTHIPVADRTDDGLVRLIEKARATEDIPKAAVGRNVKDLPVLIEDHESAVHALEKHLAKYLKDPNNLPSTRPTCYPDKSDRALKGKQKVDAIDYLTNRIRLLEQEIKQTRETVDRRNPLPYGFMSYNHIEDAHAVAYASRKKGPGGTNVVLAPRPIDIIWRNLPLARKTHRTRRLLTNLWVVLLTVIYIGPNVFTAVFLADLSHLGQVWPAFQRSLDGHYKLWSFVQGILAPTIQNAFYLILPTIFRRLLARGGDITRTSRERHVLSKLYAFYVFNNLIVFSVFSSAWQFIAVIVDAKHQNIWDAIKQHHPILNLALALCNLSPYWITWELLRNLSATIDLIQAWPLIYNSIMKRFSSPSPRQLIELTAPQSFIYAEYYSNYLFVATVGLVFSVVQPLLLPFTAFYITIDYWLKKYLLQYVFITRIESGGGFWRVVFNRFVFAVLLYQGVTALLVWAVGTIPMLCALIPLPLIMIAFKVYCSRAFDTKFKFFSTAPFSDVEKSMPPEMQGHSRNSSGAADRIASKFGHPALYQKLITPMVSAKSQHLLSQVYKGRLDDVDGFNDTQSIAGYSDIYMSNMSSERPGKGLASLREPRLPFEIVTESEMDFEHFKRRSEFRAAYGGDGELYGRPDDALSRPGTPGSMMSGSMAAMRKEFPRGRPDTAGSFGSSLDGTPRNRSQSRDGLGGTHYPRGYHAASGSGLRSGDPGAFDDDIGVAGQMNGSNFRDQFDNESVHSADGRGRLMSHPAGMGMRSDSPTGSYMLNATPLAGPHETSPLGNTSSGTGLRGYFDRSIGGSGADERSRGQYSYFSEGDGTATGFGSGMPTPLDDEAENRTSYDYFRAPGRRGNGARGHENSGSGDSAPGSRTRM